MDINWDIDYTEVTMSANDMVHKVILQNPKVKEGYGIRTGFQLHGRGQRGKQWESEKNSNILLSFVLRPQIEIKDQFRLSQVISLAIAEYINLHDIDQVKIKWPNDVYVGDKKISGILIQNFLNGDKIDKTIVGIGININQELFYSDAPNPTSLKMITGKEFDLDHECLRLLDCIGKNYKELYSVQKAKLENMYRFLLYRLNEKATFIDSDGKSFDGIIKGFDDNGKLEIQRKDGSQFFGFNEIKYVI